MQDRDASHIDISNRVLRLLRLYAVALALVFTSVLCTVFITEIEATQLEQDAGLINMSGRQRMLSQRIIYLAQQHQAATAAERVETGAALDTAIRKFEAAIDLFETSHRGLVETVADVPEIRSLYLEPGERGEASLDERVKTYIMLARRVLARPDDSDSLARLLAIEEAGLLADLDRIVSAFEAGSVARVTLLRQIELLSLGIAFAIIAVEVAFVLRPGRKLVQRSLVAMERNHRALRDARRDLARRNQELEDALENSEKLRKEQVALAYAVSHDLKAPANTLKLLLNELEHLTRDHPVAEVEDMVALAQASVGRMSVLITDTLEYAWATQNAAEPAWVDTAACAEQVISDLRADIEASGGCVTLGQMDDIFGHAGQIAVLMQNLVANGLKYQPPGSTPEVSLSVISDGDTGQGVLTVSDNGIGIDPKNHARVFDLFARLHLQGEYAGSGLGLATCQRIALNHAGAITLTSTPGTGSVFRVDLRLSAKRQPETATPIAPIERPPGEVRAA